MSSYRPPNRSILDGDNLTASSSYPLHTLPRNRSKQSLSFSSEANTLGVNRSSMNFDDRDGVNSPKSPGGARFGEAGSVNGNGNGHGNRSSASWSRRNSTTTPGRRKKLRLSDSMEPGKTRQDQEFQGLLNGSSEMDDEPEMGHPRRSSLIEAGKELAETLKRKKKIKTPFKPRTIPFGPSLSKSILKTLSSLYPPNVIRNQKYSIITFLPLVFYEQFKFFFNLYFLLVALSQFIPALKIGFIVTYIAPLAFVLCVTMGKEAYDDYQRHLRDKEANSTRYLILDKSLISSYSNESIGSGGGSMESQNQSYTKSIPSRQIKVGDIVILEKNQRVPADMVLLRTSDSVSTDASNEALDSASLIESPLFTDSQTTEPTIDLEPETQKDEAWTTGGEDAGGTCFVRTDQLDGETDWKLKLAIGRTQGMSDRELLEMCGELYADPPIKDIHTFIGNLTIQASQSSLESSIPTSTISDDIIPLSSDNALWANTVLAAGSAVGIVVYTGKETRAAMNTSEPETKVGLLDLEINRIAKILCITTFLLSLLLVAFNGFRGRWYIYVFRFLILFSSIIPISLRVNLDMGKSVYAHQIEHDPEIAGAIVRTSTLPEELGRIEYLLSDKTGTLTQNEMEMKKLHMGTIAYGWDSMDEVNHQLMIAYGDTKSSEGKQRKQSMMTGISAGGRGRRDITSRVKEAVLALATCHNVTPVTNDDGSVTYQASSPDEVAIVKWTESVGLTLISRERTSMTLQDPAGAKHTYAILSVFPFSSESKRMGIIIRDVVTGEITFMQKGADVVMAKIVQKNDWLEEECGNMAREGLRTLVVGRKRLSQEAYLEFDRRHKEAQISMGDRNAAITTVIAEHLELELELLALTGVEDKLQDGVKSTLELLRNAGLKIWMLTGDKIETATCISVSSKLVSRGQYLHTVSKLKTPQEASDQLDFIRTKLDCCLIIDGESLQLMLDTYKTEFISIATELPVVVACRCSPTQKADVAYLIRDFTKKRVCCIGDGGNDVSMIQAADVGVGIVGKEGKQASLAADFSIMQFSHLTKLLLWHGRNSYKRSAKLAQFVIHRGLIISVIQAVFSSIFFFAPIALYQGWLQVGYATLYTMAPVFSLVLDKDLSEDLALLYPELYKELTKGRTLSSKTFFIWLIISIYQGGIIMILSILLFETEFINIIAISFTALIVNELIMVALEITTWHPYMVISELATLAVYGISMMLLPEYFDLSFVLSVRFLWKVAFIIALSSLPLYLIKVIRARFAPAAYVKVSQY